MKLLATLKGIQAGKLEDKHGWREEVLEPAPQVETEANTPANVTAVSAL